MEVEHRETGGARRYLQVLEFTAKTETTVWLANTSTTYKIISKNYLHEQHVWFHKIRNGTKTNADTQTK